MIRYTLHCEHGHEFESWFRSGVDYDEQLESKFVACPFCESTKVKKALMTPALGRASWDAAPATGPEPESGPAVPMIAEPERRIRAMLRALREHVTSTAEHVGLGFAQEARAIHYGEKPARSIYGEATPDEARSLIDEGINVSPLPPAPDDRN